MKKVLISLAVLMGFAVISYAAVDYTCMNNCSRKGYMYSYCKSQCSYDSYPTIRGRKDYSCIQDCTAKGYMYNYCTQLCSY